MNMEIPFGGHTTLSTNKALKESSVEQLGYSQIYMTLLIWNAYIYWTYPCFNTIDSEVIIIVSLIMLLELILMTFSPSLQLLIQEARLHSDSTVS